MVTGFSRVLFVTILPITFMTLIARFQAHNTWYMKEWFFFLVNQKSEKKPLCWRFFKQKWCLTKYARSKKCLTKYHFEVMDFLFGNWKTFFDILSNPMLFTWRTQITCVCPKITFYWLTHCPKSPLDWWKLPF